MAADKSEASTTIDIHQQLYAKQYKHARVINPFEQCHRHLTYICFHFELISNLNFFTRVHKSFFRSLVITVRDLYLWSDIYICNSKIAEISISENMFYHNKLSYAYLLFSSLIKINLTVRPPSKVNFNEAIFFIIREYF